MSTKEVVTKVLSVAEHGKRQADPAQLYESSASRGHVQHAPVRGVRCIQC
jgi:hypothetical protein